MSTDRFDYGYKSNLFTLANNFRFVVLIFPSPIPRKELADTTYCGLPFVFKADDILIYPKVMVIHPDNLIPDQEATPNLFTSSPKPGRTHFLFLTATYPAC